MFCSDYLEIPATHLKNENSNDNIFLDTCPSKTITLMFVKKDFSRIHLNKTDINNGLPY